MKKLLLFCMLYSFFITARGQGIQRRINFTPIDKDSLDLALDAGYNLIEDSCATIIRHVRLNFDTKKFHGKFTDVRKDNPAVTLTEGNYNDSGLKDGIFTLRYSSGNIRAKGSFKDDDFDGRWELFYENGKPELNFEVKDGVCSIIDSWNSSGAKIIDKGSGTYVADLSFYAWKGKLVNGRPDGTWKMYQTRDEDKQTISTEHFKKGEFIDGENKIGDYTNASRIKLLSPAMFPFINTEKMYVGAPCNIKLLQRTVVNAHYKAGMDAFNYNLRDALSGFFSHIDLEGKEGRFDIVGEISTEGHIENLVRKGGSNTDDLTGGIMSQIRRLPTLIPATINGKPVTEQFKISLEVSKGSYSYQFEFMPIRIK